MAQGKSGKADPVKIVSKAKKASSVGGSVQRTVFKTSQGRDVLKSVTRLRISRDASRALCFGVTYICREMIEGAHTAAIAEGKKKIQPKHINACIALDNELKHVGHRWLLKSGGTTAHLVKGQEATEK